MAFTWNNIVNQESALSVTNKLNGLGAEVVSLDNRISGKANTFLLIYGDTSYTLSDLKQKITDGTVFLIQGIETSQDTYTVNAVDVQDEYLIFRYTINETQTGGVRYTGAQWEILTTVSLASTNSPTFTGIPKAPTATTGTNTEQLATTEFVQNAINNTGIYWIQYNKATFTEAEYNKIASLENTETAIGIYDASPGMTVAWNLGTHQIYVMEDTPSNSGITLIFTTSIAKYTCFIKASNYSATWTKVLSPEYIYNNKDKTTQILVWVGTQTEFEAITTKDTNTLYFVEE